MDKKPLISVIIPVYNLGREIIPTLDSVCGQSYGHLQIVVVNDGSTDESLRIVREYAARDSRIAVVDKPNEGLALARRSGLERAEGDYIHHLDGGDILAPGAYELLVDTLRSNGFPDVVMFEFRYRFADGRTSDSCSYPFPEGWTDSMDMLRHIWFTQNYHSTLQYLHRRSLACELHFDSRLSLGEDLYYTTQLLYRAGRVWLLHARLFDYVQDAGSMTRCGRYSDRAVESTLLFPELVYDFMRDKPEFESVQKELLVIRLVAYLLLIRMGRRERMKMMVTEIRRACQQYPELRSHREIHFLRKLLALYGRFPLLYRIELWHYRREGKVL